MQPFGICDRILRVRRSSWRTDRCFLRISSANLSCSFMSPMRVSRPAWLDVIGDLHTCVISFSKDGSLWRLVDCYTVLGIPTICGRWLSISKNRCLEYEGTNDLGHRMRDEMKLSEILELDVRGFCDEVNQRCAKRGLSPFGSFMRYINEELHGYILVFVASNIARYRPALWQNVVEGSDEMAVKMNRSVTDAYSHYVRGAPISPHCLDAEHNFMSIVKNILERAQNDHYLKEDFKGSFA